MSVCITFTIARFLYTLHAQQYISFTYTVHNKISLYRPSQPSATTASGTGAKLTNTMNA